MELSVPDIIILIIIIILSGFLYHGISPRQGGHTALYKLRKQTANKQNDIKWTGSHTHLHIYNYYMLQLKLFQWFVTVSEEI